MRNKIPKLYSFLPYVRAHVRAYVQTQSTVLMVLTPMITILRVLFISFSLNIYIFII